MKNKLLIKLSFLAVLFLFVVTCRAEGAVMYGDVSGNGSVTAYDASLAAQYAVGLLVLTPEQVAKADVSANGVVSAFDAGLIAQYAVGSLTELAAPALKEQLTYFASGELQGRAAGSPGGILARNYVTQRFTEIGLQPAGDNGTYTQAFSTSYANVIGIFPGTDPILRNEAVVIGAHYDHLGMSGSTIYYGADDNGSGTIALIRIAQKVNLVREQLRRTVIFVAFDAEEKGLLGSKYYVGNPVIPMNNTVYMINLDMIGYLNKKINLQCIGGTTSSSAAAMITDIAGRYPVGIPNLNATTGGSDHGPFASAGIKYVFFHTGTDVSPYHTAQDTADKIDYYGMWAIAEVTRELALRISQEETRPQAIVSGMAAQKTLGAAVLEAPEMLLDHGAFPFQK